MPVVPEVPLVPVVPEVPLEPVVPEVPLEPVVPLVPGAPSLPLLPLTTNDIIISSPSLNAPSSPILVPKGIALQLPLSAIGPGIG